MSFKRRRESKRESSDIESSVNVWGNKVPLKVDSEVNVMNKRNGRKGKDKDKGKGLTYRLLNIFVLFGLFPSVLGLGVMSGLLVFGEIDGAFKNKALLSSFNYRDTFELDAADVVEFKDHVDKYKNVKALAGIKNLERLLNNSAIKGSDNEKFILYTGTEACIWCRFNHNVDDNYLYENTADFVSGDANGIIQSMNTFFAGKVGGALNNQGVNNKGLIYELHDLKATTVSDYHSGTSKEISSLLLSRLPDKNDIKFVSEIIYKDGVEVSLSSNESGASFTTADGYQRFHDLYTTGDSDKMRENLTSVGNSIKERLLDDGTYGTPAWWFIKKGKPLYFTSTYFTIAALEKVVDWHFNDGNLV